MERDVEYDRILLEAMFIVFTVNKRKDYYIVVLDKDNSTSIKNLSYSR